MTNENRSLEVEASVPGVIHTDLLAAGVISEPYFGFNELDQHWVALDNWTYTRNFTLAANVSSHSAVWLVFEGLDTIANISLNGQRIGPVSLNAFVPWEQELSSTGLLHQAPILNTVQVAFECAQSYGQRQAAAYPVQLREFRANRFSFSGRPFVRKSQTHFGWNWGL